MSFLGAIFDVTVDKEVQAFAKFTEENDNEQGVQVATAVASAVRATVAKWNHSAVGGQ